MSVIDLLTADASANSLQGPVDVPDNNDPLNLPHDPLVLSWGRYHREQSGQPYVSLENIVPTAQDQEQAQLCRRYYQDKIMMLRLRGREPSSFQNELYSMLTGIARKKHWGMLYRLPYFYVEDQLRAALPTQFQPWDRDLYVRDRPEVLLNLVPVQIIDCRRRSEDRRQYWWRDQLGGAAVLWQVSMKNSLFSLVQGLWDRQQPVRVTGRPSIIQRQEWSYLQLQYPRLVLDHA